jgi:tetratricopeptide (TPR) repeat protein
MPQPQGFGSPAFDHVARGTIRLHKLIAEGRGDEPEADEVRDALDGPIAVLTPEERTRAQFLSADLYSLSKVQSDHEQLPMNPHARAKLKAVVQARDAGQWDKALALLRRWQRYAALEFVSFQRGMIWDRAGKPEIAVEFYRHAAELSPDGFMPAIYLSALARVDSVLAVAESWHVVKAGCQYAPAVRVQAAYVILIAVRSDSHALAHVTEDALIPMLKAAVEDLERNGESIDGAMEMATLLLGVAYQRSGDDASAYEALSRGLLARPRSVPLLTLRGLLMYGSSADAIGDLLAADQLPAETAWPSFCLAHHYLVAGDFAACRAMCAKALKLAATNTMSSKVLEWLAISEAELQVPSDAVLGRFELAISLDPQNDLAKANMAIFVSYVDTPVAHDASWKRPSESTVREQGLQGYAPPMDLHVPYDLAA